ncbi:hypothetical protein DFJ58DRAFT_840115 [Suillus subalutaceus]|uniref:uncharacterized protein n=1 Tax=Suillus subalutaceus TaxID=48586 RepID=UPI001B864E94|nr:uncharacterized protein DFJ58DRAFT_840115 [Suillus subalutaceus]KAG1859528.1 hypothetical protein DFJ58DRAFT_840115 [Suillus subalutaceus]
MSSDDCNGRLSLCSPSRSFAISNLVFVLGVLKIVTLVSFYVVVIMAGLAFDVYRCQLDPSTLQDPDLFIHSPRLQEAEKAVFPLKATSSSATCTSSPSGFPSSSSSPAILESSLDSPRLVPEPRLHWSISCSDISPQFHNAPIGPGHHIHALFSDAWSENAVLLKQLLRVQDALDTANSDIDNLVLANLTMTNQMDRFTRDLEIEQSANTALRFEIANLKAERDKLIAEKKSSDLQQEHGEEVQALQGTLVRTKRELEGAKRELRKLKRAAAGIPELKIISPDGKVIPHITTSSSTDSLNEDRNIAMRERLTLAYTEVVGLRDQCEALRRHADENAELQEDVKQLLAQRSGLWDQVEAATSACRKLEEENKKYFRQFVEIRAELTKVEKRTGIAISVIEEEEEEPEIAGKAEFEVPPTNQGCRSAFDDDSDDESITSSVSCYSMASTDDFDECTDFAFDVVPGSPLADAISVYASIHQPIGVSHRPFVIRRGLGIPIVRPSWPPASSVVTPFDEASPKRKLALDLDDATPKTRRKHDEFGRRLFLWFAVVLVPVASFGWDAFPRGS